MPPRSIFTGQKLVLRARLTLGTELGSGTEFPEWFTGQKLVLRARLTFGDRPALYSFSLYYGEYHFLCAVGTMTFWDRIPRIGPILQRTPQKHFHRTKTRFKGAFDFWGQNWVLGQNSPNLPNSPAYPPGAFSPDKNSF